MPQFEVQLRCTVQRHYTIEADDAIAAEQIARNACLGGDDGDVVSETIDDISTIFVKKEG